MKLKIKGMHCQSCINLIKMALEEEDIRAKVSMNLVEFDDISNIKKIKEIIKKEGYEVE